MIKEKFDKKIKYLYHFTKKDNVDKILKDKKLVSSDSLVFFTGSMSDCTSYFEREMMSNNLYVDIDHNIKKRIPSKKEDYKIIRIPFVNDNSFYKLVFNNNNSTYNLSIVHDGELSFDKAKVLNFENNNLFQVRNALAVSLISLLFIPSVINASTWLDDGKYDLSWYNEAVLAGINTCDIDNEEELAGLAYKVNEDDITFENYVLNINSDMDLTENEWVSIDDIFSGSIEGAHKIILRNSNRNLFSNYATPNLTFDYKYAVKINDTLNGNVSSDKAFALNEEVVKLTITPDNKYKVKSVVFKNSEGNIINNIILDENNQFEMLEEDINVSVEFELIAIEEELKPTDQKKETDTKEIVNPKTEDTIYEKLVIMIISFIGLVGSLRILKK